ncbi:MAG TPA: hypothetical protein VLG39_06755 [Nitrospirota bacterium]|nr:hypothetical protein [Nitrospirota bacterium]
MKNYHDTMRDDRFMILEIKAEQIRKMLLGSLLLAKDAWMDALLGTPEGLRVLETVDEAADEFIDTSLADPVEKIDNALNVINKRARAVVVVLDYLSQHKK